MASTAEGVPNRLDERLIRRCDEIPDEPATGIYVVVDTLHFSNTVIELLANGADYVHITDERGDERSYREANPDTIIGAEPTQSYHPIEGYDFFNSPSDVQNVDVEGRPVSMTSSNGGRAVATLRARLDEDSDVYVGSTMNARALAAHLRSRAEPVALVSAGSNGEVAVEDHIGATLISRYLDEIPVSKTERAVFRRQLKTAKGADYVETNEVRRRDVLDYAMNLNSRTIVPRLDGDSLVDITRRSESAASAGAQLAD